MKETEVKRVAITLVGDSNPRDVEYGGVVELPEGQTVDDVERLYGEWRRSEARCGFTDWLLERGFKDDGLVGYPILFAEDHPTDSVPGEAAAATSSSNTGQWHRAWAESSCCPYCGSHSWHQRAFDGETTAYLTWCDECESSWWDAYRFTGFEPCDDRGNWNESHASEEHCPYCGSRDWQREVFDNDKGFPALCSQCGSRWWERYERTGFEPYPEEEEDD